MEPFSLCLSSMFDFVGVDIVIFGKNNFKINFDSQLWLKELEGGNKRIKQIERSKS